MAPHFDINSEDVRLTAEDGEHIVIRGEIGSGDENLSITKWEAMRVAWSFLFRAMKARWKPGAMTLTRTEGGRLTIEWKDEPRGKDLGKN